MRQRRASATSRQYVTANQLVRDSFRLARKIYDSGYRPDILLVLWRGGTPVGIVVHEFLLYQGIDAWHTAIKAESYQGIGQRTRPRIDSLTAILRRVKKTSRILIVDDIFDTGCTLKKVTELLRRKTKAIRTATLFYKPSRNRTDLKPDFFIRKTDRWIVFPHELMGLTPAEIRRKDPSIARLIRGD